MQRSLDGPYVTPKNGMQQEPQASHVFAFFNRRTTRIKALYFDYGCWHVVQQAA